MSVNVAMAKLGPEMETGLLTEWLIADGDVVEEGQAVATIETDKVTTDLEAPATGPINIFVEAGAEYPVGTVLAAIGADASRTVEAPAPHVPVPPPGGAQPEGDSRSKNHGKGDGVSGNGAPQTGPQRRAAVAEQRRGEPLATPVARRMAQALGISLVVVQPIAHGRVIRKRDVEAVHEAARADRLAPTAATTDRTSTELSPMRRRIAQRMHNSLLETAQITDFREHEVSELIEFRRTGLGWAGPMGFRVSFTDLFVRATAIALREVPALNVSLDENNRLISHEQINIGLAVALPEGLIVPVLRDVEALSLSALHEQIVDLVTRAREERLTLQEVGGGTFTLTNIGTYGSHTATPILVAGQVGILGTGAFIQRPVVRDGAVVVGNVMHTSLTIDHRIVDGQTAGDFQRAWGHAITHPEELW